MFSEQLIINRLASQTSYEVLLADDKMMDQQVPLVTPRVYVGHLELVPRDMDINSVYMDGYTDLEKPLLLKTSLLIVCARTELATVRNAVATAYKGWNPIPNQGEYSQVMFLQGGTLQATTTLIWWNEIIGTGTPRLV